MIGIDITKISRFKDFSESKIKKFLHPKEIELLNKTKNKEKFLAARWAIKEALFKNDNSLFHFDKIYIEQKNRIYTYEGYNISTSSEDDYLVAIAEKRKHDS